MAVWQIGQPLQAADFYWDSDASTIGNNTDGTGLGGTGTWDTATSNWWNLATLGLWPNMSTDTAIFSGPFVGGTPTLNSVTLSTGITANQLSFHRSGYTLTGGDLTLAGTTPTLFAQMGESATIDSQILGTAGLTKLGGGFIRLGNNTNSYTGTTTISNGGIIITGQGALGASTDAIVVTGFAPSSSTNLGGADSGTLVLDGTGGNITISRDLSLQGQGPTSIRGAALVSFGDNTLSGEVTMGTPYTPVATPTFLNTRIMASDGTLNLTGTLNVLGTAGTTISSLGGVNQAGASFYNVSGVLAGTGTLESSGGGTLFLNPSDTSGFSGMIRVSGGAASGQSVVRIDSPNVLGTRTNSTTGAVLDLNGGVLAVLMDAPEVKVSNGSNANVYFRTSSTIFADHTPGSSVKDQTVAFGNLSYEDNITLTFNSRNGYGMSFTTAPVAGSTAGDNNNTITNNLQGGAQLTFTGNFWSNANNTGNRTMTINGNGNTTINGNIVASAAAFDHSLTKAGAGTLTLLGTNSTLDGNINIQGGTVAISDRRAITNNSSNINIGNTTTAGTLSIIGNNATQTNLTFAKVISLSGTTGGATILANQTGSSPGVIFSSDFTATGAGAKTLTLGGTNIGANTIDGAIVNSTANTALTKIDAGRWVLAGTNTYTGNTTISNGILQLKANAAASTILADTSGINFAATNNFAGGTLEFIGQASTNNVETLGAISYAAGGAATIKLTPGSGGTASLIFSNMSTGAGGTLNFVGGDFTNNTFTVNQINAAAGSDGIITRSVYWNGGDFAYRQGGVLRAPVYGVDAGTVTSATTLAAGHNEITGSFATNSISISTLKINGGQTLTLNGGQTLTLAGFGLLATGGSSTITGGDSLTVGGANTLVVRVDGGADSLRIETPLTGFTGGLTKSGAGTLVLAGANTQTGTVNIAEGTVRLSGGTLGGAGALTIRQDGILELNGVTPNNVNAFNNNGIVRNTSATTDVVFTVGGANGTGTSNGIIEDGGAANISVVKTGTGAQSWLGLSTYTGSTTIGSTGIVSINNLQDGGSPSGIGASSNAAGNLIFTGASATQAFGGLNYTGTTNDETDRLFTFGGTAANSGARIQSNGVNGATSTWTNPGALAFGTPDIDQGLVLGGASTGDNRFFPIINDNGTGVVSVYKADAGVWYLEATNNYTGPTTIRGGALYVNTGTSLPTASNLVLDGGSIARTGAFTRTLGTGANQVQFGANAAGGFSAGGSPLTVDFGTGAVWGTGPFLGTGALLLNNSGVAKSDVDVISGFEITQGVAIVPNATTTAGSATVTLTSGTTAGLAIGQEVSGNPNIPAGRTIATITGPTTFTLNSATGVLAGVSAATTINAGGYRQVNVGDFTSIGADFGTISGVITGAGSLAKEGAGILNLRGANTYTGQTLVRAGTLVVETLGNSSSPGATSVGDSTLGNTDAGAITLGNGGTGAGILEYVGLGETSNRKIRLNTTTGSTQLHADGVGPLILTNVANDMTAGAKALFLRGTNQAGNMITSQLSDNGGALSITLDSSATWILTNAANNYTGVTSVNGGALGIGDDAALGTGLLSFNTGSVFAYGADRTITNAIDQDNNTTIAFIGAHSLNFTQVLDNNQGANNNQLTNSLVAGKTLTIPGMTVDDITANRVWTVDGSGETIIAGDITTTQTTNRGLQLTKTGDGILELQGTGSNFNRNNQAIDIDRGTLRLGANNVIPDGLDTQAVPIAYGGITLSPDAAFGDTAILDLNGKSETINALTANTDGIAIIDNTSATAASLTFGAADAAVSFGGGIGTYTIQNSGGGALSITKTGNAAAVIPTGVTLTHTGTTSVNGGSLTIASPVNGTTGLSVTNSGSILALTGGITTPSAITGLVVDGGATLSLLDGAGSLINSLTTLSLGVGAGTATLNLNVGDSATDTLTLLTGSSATLANTITFNLTDAGLSPSTTYTLLNLVDGGINAFGLGNMVQGATPGGFLGSTFFVNDNLVQFTTGTLITGSSWWNANGTLDNWSDVANWAVTDKTGANAAVSIPGQGTDVVFIADNIVGGAAVSTTLEQNFKINSLTLEASTNPANTPSSVTIAPGAVSTNRLEVAPQLPADGIKITAGGPAAATISAPVKIGANQTWGVADAASVLTLSGGLQGEADVTKTGAGKVTLTAAADPTFNSGVTSDFAINAGTLELTNSAALGNTVNANLANVAVNSTGAFYYNNATASTIATGVANPLTLGGGTLSAGGNSQFYNGTVNVSADSFINMADSNGPGSATVRSITLSGVLSGSGKLTVNSNTTSLTGGNAEGGQLIITNSGNTWNGPVVMNSGTIITTATNGLGDGGITFNEYGRIIMRNVNGTVYNLASTMDFTAGAIGEFSVDNTSGVLASDFVINQNGLVTLGSGGTGASARFNLADAASQLNITGGVSLGGPSSISVEGGDADSVVTISSVISEAAPGYTLAVNDDAGGWAATNTRLRLTGANTFTGNVTLDSGILEFDTVTGISGAASSLGQGTAIDVTNSATLSFIGTSAQTTNRPINSLAGALTLSANGTGVGTQVEYSGLISITSTATGNNLVLTGTAGSVGVISGGISQTGDLADALVNGGSWTISGAGGRIADTLTVQGTNAELTLAGSSPLLVRNDVIVTGATSVLNLNTTGALSFNTATLSADASLLLRDGAVVNLGANDAVVAADFDRLFLGQDASGATVTLNMNAFDLSTNRLILGERLASRSGIINGTGTLTVIAGDIDLFDGTINAKLASTGTATIEKFGPGTVTLAGDNIGVASTGASIVNEGTLVLDYATSNTTKLRTASQLSMIGGNLVLNGNASAATSQDVASFTLGSGGSNQITLNTAGGQDIVLNLGAITRGNVAQDGTIRFILPSGTQSATNGITTTSPNSAFGMLGTGGTVTSDAAYATVNDGTGTWFAKKATDAAGVDNIVALISTAKNDVTTWALGDHITDTVGGFSGTLQSASINSLRFDDASGSDVSMPQGGVLLIGSGGFLITDQVGGTPSLTGGTLSSGATELVITQDSTQSFEIDSDIRINGAVTKSGAGTLLLSGNNVYTGVTEIQDGTLQIGGGNAIGDISLVTLATNRNSTLELLADETIGRLQGGRRNDNSDYGIVAVDTHTLTINQAANTNYSGVFTGTGNIAINGPGNLNLNNRSTGFTGVITVDTATLILGQAGEIGASTIRVRKGSQLLFDNTSTTGPTGSHVPDTTTITLNSADGGFSGQAIVRGLSIRVDQTNRTADETVGLVNLNSGASYVGMEASSTGADADIIANDITRLNNSTLSVRGYNLGIVNTRNNQFRIGDATNQTAFIANLVGGGGAAASKNISIVPWAIGENLTANLAAGNMGNSLVTYDSGAGFRPLDLTPGTGEYNTYAASAVTTENIRESLSADLTGLSGKTINALVLNNDATLATVNVTGSGAGQNLAVTSGAMLFTVTGAATNTAYSTVLGGFNDGITVGGTNEYVVSVVNPNSGTNLTTGGTTFGSTRVTVASTTGLAPGMAVYGAGIPVGATVSSVTSATVFEMTLPSSLSTSSQTFQYTSSESLTASIASPLTSTADITKSGRGALILSGTNTAGGGANKTTINEGTLEIADLDNIGGNTGDLVFSGGTLRLGTGLTDDISQRNISILQGGATIDTNGVSLALANSVGSGNGGLTKTGAGNLTLNAAAAYTGATTVLGGTLTVGANDATGNGGDLGIGAGATLDIGVNSITAGLVQTFGISPTLSGTGTINASKGFYFGNTGNITVDAVLAGPGGLFKNQTTVLTLSGASTYTGTTEIQAGTISFDSIANVGGGASALGAPTTVEAGIIRTGLTSTSAVLTYTGAGSTTDRIIEMQGTTGGLTINGNGSGALALGAIQTANNGNKTLTLQGTSASNIDNSVSSILEVGAALSLSKTGTNTWVVNGTNNYTGATTAGGGTLRAGSNGAFSSSLITLTGTGSVLELANGVNLGNALTVSNTGNNKILGLQDTATSGEYSGTIAIAETTAGNFDVSAGTGGTLTLSGVISGAVAGGVSKVGLGTVILSGTSANTYTGVTGVTAGELHLGKTADTNAVAGDINVSGGTLKWLANNQVADTSSITQSAGAINLNGKTETLTSYTKTGGTFRTGIGGKLILTGATFTFDGAGSNIIDAEGSIEDGHLVVTNGATVDVYGANNISYDPVGTFGGELQLNAAGAGLEFGAGTNTINLDSDTSTVNVGKLILKGNVSTSGVGSATIASVGAGAFKGLVDLDAGNRTFTIGATNGLEVSALMINGGLTKEGAGTMNLTNAAGNSYDLGTTVNAGTLLVNNTSGSGTGTGDVTIDSLATLGGSGIIAPTGLNGSVSVQGLLNVGNAGDTAGVDFLIDMSGASGAPVIDLTGGITLDYFGGQGSGIFNTPALSFNDQLGITGNGATLNLGGDLTFNNFNSFAPNTFTAGTSWSLFAWTGLTSTTGSFSNITGTIGNFAGFTDLSAELLAWDFTNLYSSGTVSIVAIPEPSRAMLLLLGLLGLGLRRRRSGF
jgi:autotransporter-associated beta strand protein